MKQSSRSKRLLLLEDRVTIKMLPETVSPGGITLLKHQAGKPERAEVVAAGPEAYDLAPGDTVLVVYGAGLGDEIDGNRLIRYGHVICKLEAA